MNHTNSNPSYGQDGFLRIKQIIGDLAHNVPPLIPVSRSTWWAWVQSGKAPQPIKLSPGVTAWKADEIFLFIESLKRGYQ